MTVQVTEEVFAAAQREAVRRGVAVSVIVDEALRRFVGGADLHRLLGQFRSEDRSSELWDDDAMAIANEELSAVRNPRTS